MSISNFLPCTGLIPVVINQNELLAPGAAAYF
jgi:hypothetical protein